MSYHSWFECIRGCGHRYSIYDVIYRCEECGGLLDVKHDLEALRKRGVGEWKKLFRQRAGTAEWPYSSGVWGKKEWVCPQVEDENIVSMAEGNTHCFRATRLGVEVGVPDLWVKLCGSSHTGSFKDLGMTVLISVVRQMIADGRPIRAVACASTGDTSASLAAYAAAADIPAVILLPRGKISTEQLIQPIAHGALVIELDTDFDGCMQIVRELTADPTIYLANSMNALRLEGQKTVGMEIAQQFDWQAPDWIVVPAGNLGNVSALGKGLIMMKEVGLIDKLPRIVCAQSDRANPFYLSALSGFRQYRSVKARKTMASAIQIGDPVSYERAVEIIQSLNGAVEQVSEQELSDAAAQADRIGLYACPQTGVALAAVPKLVKSGLIHPSERVVVISTAHGLKFTAFKVSYHSQKLRKVAARYANPPLELPPDLHLVNRAIDRRLG